MKLGSKKIIGGKAQDIIDGMKNDDYSESKKNFLKESKATAKKHSN